MKAFNLFPVFLLSSTAFSLGANLIFFNTANYKGRADNPILQNSLIAEVYVEDFEIQGLTASQILHTPNATGWNGVSVGSIKWGVQEDYSDTDLSYFWTNSGGSDSSRKPPNGIHFDFTPDAQGRLPEYAGAALRGKGLLGNGPAFNVILVYDRNGVEVTEGQWQIPKPVFNPNLPIEDLFLNFEGIYVPGGISSIHFRDFTEVDHLTYGYSIPEPSAALLATAAGLLCLRRKRKIIP